MLGDKHEILCAESHGLGSSVMAFAVCSETWLEQTCDHENGSEPTILILDVVLFEIEIN